MKITKIWFDADYIYGKDENEKEYKQSLLWYPKLREASDEERSQYVFGLGGIHWRNLDEDISFELIWRQQPTPTQRLCSTATEGSSTRTASSTRSLWTPV